MSLSSEIRSWALAVAGVLCLSAITYRVWTLPSSAAQTIAPVAASLTSAAQTIAPVANHLQATADAATRLLDAAQPVVLKLSTTEAALNDAVALTSHRLNDLCPVPNAPDAALRPCGTLADFNRTLATVRGTAGQAEESMIVFNKHEGDLFTQESAAYSKLDASVTDFDNLVTDPDLKGIIGNGNVVLANAAAVTTDGRTWVHQKLFPTKRKGFISGFEATGDVLMHWVPPIF
jgi:hypothetical protein